MVSKWLTCILNAAVELEAVPDALKSGLVIPIYKGAGKDPLCLDSYRGITITSVISKVLESLLLERMESTFVDAGNPHINQTAYKKSTSCSDAIFATLEAISRYLKNGTSVHMCLYDLQKAVDSIAIPILLQ